jgi:hypothetical protein
MPTDRARLHQFFREQRQGWRAQTRRQAAQGPLPLILVGVVAALYFAFPIIAAILVYGTHAGATAVLVDELDRPVRLTESRSVSIHFSLIRKGKSQYSENTQENPPPNGTFRLHPALLRKGCNAASSSTAQCVLSPVQALR